MAAGHPEGLPDLFLDRSLGRRQIPALLREAGLRLHTLAEVYGVPADEDVVDTVWLQLAGQREWPVLMKDERIRYRPAAHAVNATSSLRAFPRMRLFEGTLFMCRPRTRSRRSAARTTGPPAATAR